MRYVSPVPIASFHTWHAELTYQVQSSSPIQCSQVIPSLPIFQPAKSYRIRRSFIISQMDIYPWKEKKKKTTCEWHPIFRSYALIILSLPCHNILYDEGTKNVSTIASFPESVRLLFPKNNRSSLWLILYILIWQGSVLTVIISFCEHPQGTT
jgi:hypothetical protein